ncbi:DUF3466 family protein [Agarivorans sp. TSD2052]|uniref:DUF3466 family protein n=1 Tax=Agarivorans sp. TSD2052 TaxID=2937286 RepID=UPI00200E7837|nr:DUF3466 family protein [Agarivorans sp. TSD2052]UPW20488.1 DUF3466 family protein [Agarivorans sp. TSD2052]
MKKSILNCSMSLVFAPLVLSASLAHAAQTESYYLIEEIPLSADSETGLAEANSNLSITAVSEEGEYVAGNVLTFRTSFRFYDFSDRTTYDYGCQYASEVCRLFLYGDNSFYETYRDRLREQKSVQYLSNVLSFVAENSVSGNHTDGKNIQPLPTWDTVKEKLYVFDDISNEIYTTDTRVNSINNTLGWAVGYDSAPFIDDSGTSYTRDFIQRGFAYRLSDQAKVTLLPTAFSTSGELSDENGGVSSGLQVIEKDGKTLVIGMASTGYAGGSTDSFNECQTGNRENYYRCSGFHTQAWVWDITDADDGAQVEGTQLVDGYVRSRYGEAASYNLLKNGNGSVFVGTSSDDVYNSTNGSRGRAAFYTENEDGTYTVNKIPNIKIDGDNSNFEDAVSHTWANDINDSSLVIGNLRFVEVKSRNRAVEGFIYDNDENSDDYESVVWPLRNKPFSGANSEFSSINNDGLLVGWVDGLGEDQPSYNGTTRRQSAILLDINRYKEGDSSYFWRLNYLTCYEQDGEAEIPYYRIEHATHITEEGDIFASGFHYESANDFIYGINPRAVLLKLTRNPNVTDIDDVAACPNVEEVKYERKGASSSLWLLLLLPLVFVRRFKKS